MEKSAAERSIIFVFDQLDCTGEKLAKRQKKKPERFKTAKSNSKYILSLPYIVLKWTPWRLNSVVPTFGEIMGILRVILYKLDKTGLFFRCSYVVDVLWRDKRPPSLYSLANPFVCINTDASQQIMISSNSENAFKVLNGNERLLGLLCRVALF